jgi:hypothetical protein
MIAPSAIVALICSTGTTTSSLNLPTGRKVLFVAECEEWWCECGFCCWYRGGDE